MDSLCHILAAKLETIEYPANSIIGVFSWINKRAPALADSVIRLRAGAAVATTRTSRAPREREGTQDRPKRLQT